MTDDTQRKVDIYRQRPGLDALAKRFMASTPETDPARQASVGYDDAASSCQAPASADSACAFVRYPSGREAAFPALKSFVTSGLTLTDADKRDIVGMACEVCGGRGEIGGQLSDGSYQTDPCPKCGTGP